MRVGICAAVLAGALACATVPAAAQPSRLGKDVIWARQAPGAVITLDGVLDEPAWASAEQRVVTYPGFNQHDPNGYPGSGQKEEGGKLAVDPTHATFRFLTVGNTLYIAATVRDTSVGGGPDFNRFDGLLMSFKNHAALGFPKGPAEFFYSWWYPDTCDHAPSAPGKPPDFRGQWGNRDGCTPRTPGMIAVWDGATRVRGLANSDAVLDSGYVMEMRFNLDSLGYNVTQAAGDVIEWNASIYDTDWMWPFDANRFSVNRVWWQSPWGRDMWYHQVQIHAKPSVTIASGPVPAVAPDIIVPNGAAFASPVIDGLLTDAVWAQAPHFDIRHDDDALRATYPGVLRYRSGQYQPEVLEQRAEVLDPGDMTVRWFFKADTLFLGFDVRDISVTNHPIDSRWDGVITTIQDRAIYWRDNNLESRPLTFHVGTGGAMLVTGGSEIPSYLPVLRDSLNGARFALALKPGTTVDTLGNNQDTGYTAELAITLTKLGYPAGRGDGLLFIGFDLLDGDCFTPATLSYSTRTWWGREREHQCCPAWAYMDPNVGLTDVPFAGGAGRLDLLGNHPNPFHDGTVIRYALERPGHVTLEVFDLQGRQVARRALGLLAGGPHQYAFSAPRLGPGLYLYRLRVTDATTRAEGVTRSGKMMIIE
jgi:hypothetical protein